MAISFSAGVVRLEKAFALAVHANPAGNQVGLARLDVAIAFDARDAPGLFQFAQHPLQFLLAMRRQAKQAQQFRHVQRHVSPFSKQTQKL